jgi:DNA-binding MarR family transcriptional regulator
MGKFDRRNSLGYLVNHAGRLFARALDRGLASRGVSHGQFPILIVLWEEDGLTQSEIARRLDIEQPTVANTLKRMERDGLISTAPDPANARRVRILLTERARALEGDLTGEADAVNEAAANGMNTEEVGRLRDALERLIAQLAKRLAEPPER